jgi:hypothetical protein
LDLLQGIYCKRRAVPLGPGQIPGCLCPEGLGRRRLLGKFW